MAARAGRRGPTTRSRQRARSKYADGVYGWGVSDHQPFIPEYRERGVSATRDDTIRNFASKETQFWREGWFGNVTMCDGHGTPVHVRYQELANLLSVKEVFRQKE